MKIRLLEKKLKELGYQLKRKRGKGNHRIYFNPLSRKTILISGNQQNDAKYYQLKFLTVELRG